MKDLKKGELQNILDSKEPVVIFFYMESCGHCKAMQKPWKELEEEEPHTKFVKIESAEIPPEMGINGFPHFEKREGKKVKKVVKGEMSKDELKQKLFSAGGKRRTRRRRAGRLTRRGRKARK